MTTDPWQVDRLDLPAYLDAVGLPAEPPSLDALVRLQRAHVRRFTFDNVDVLLGTHPGVGLEAVQEKFLGRGRGGYCLEHTTLLAAAIQRLGYDAERHLGRVGDPTLAPRTHMGVIVRLDGQRYQVDAGFGFTPTEPILLRDGAEADLGGWRHRVLRHETPAGPTWELQRLASTGWQRMHTTDELPVHPVDVVMGHHMAGGHPSSHFTRTLTLMKHLPDRHVALADGQVTIRRPGAPTERHPLGEGELDDLVELLQPGLSPSEVDAVRAWVRSEESGG